MKTLFSPSKEYIWMRHHPKDFLVLKELYVSGAVFETTLGVSRDEESLDLEHLRVNSNKGKGWIVFINDNEDEVLVNNDEIEPNTLYAIDLTYTDYRIRKFNSRLAKRYIRSEKPLYNFF